jgi:hypothetical protein
MQSKFEYDYRENFKKYNSRALGLITIWRRNHTRNHSQKEGRWYDSGYKRRSPILALFLRFVNTRVHNLLITT